MEAVVTYMALTVGAPVFQHLGITGKDLLKRDGPHIPEAMGIVAGIVLCFFIQRGAVFWCTLFGLWIGALDDIIDIKWRTKLVMSAIAYVPLYQNNTNILLFGNLIELGMFYHVYMLSWCIWCGNAINIYAGINGLESGQCLIIAIGLFCITQEYDIVRYICVCFVLFWFNRFPASMFVGDSWCYLSGMFFVASAQHDTEKLAVMMIPQILNTVLSLPELMGECPRHRMPKYDRKNNVLMASGKGTLLNALLIALGPMSEERLCCLALCIQCICVVMAIII